MLLCSKVIRAIFWDTLRHPFTPSRVEVYDDGEIRVVHLRFPKDAAQDPNQTTPAQGS